MLNRMGQQHDNPSLIMDRAYEGDETRQLALALGYTPVVPPKPRASTLGNTTGRCTSDAMKSNDCFVV